MIQLRPYQQELEANVGQALRRVRRVLLQLPPGGGKTAIATSICQKFAARDSSAWFICHRAELVEQTSKTFSKFGLAHGFIVAGMPHNMAALVQVCSIDTLKNRLDNLKPPRIALIDECHHSGAAGWALVIEWLVAGRCQVIGLSGTPRRHDGAGLNKHFDELIPGPTPAWLIENGYLSPYEIYAPSAPDMKGVGKRMGDYEKGDTEKRMREPKLTGSMTQHWHSRLKGLRTIGFAVNVSHSQYLVQEFKAAGIRAAHLDGGTKKTERRDIIMAFADGELDVIFNVGLFGEGFDLSAIAQREVTIDAVIDAAPGLSLPWYLQKAMRAMRPAPGKVAIIMDHAGNCHRHGFPDDEHEWTLDGKTKGKKAANDNAPPPPVNCDKCFRQIRHPLPPCCPNCGKRLLAEFKPLEVAEGVLGKMTEADKRATRAKLKREEQECKDLGAFAALGKERGYKNPVGWAHKRMGARMAKQHR